MENSEMKAYMRSNMKIIEFAIKKWKLLILIGLIAGVFAAVFSMPEFISPKFKSEAVIYPANLGQYAEETGLEQMQQYLESNEIRNYIISKFNLYDEYEIDSTVRSSKTAIYKVYTEHISFDETKYESIRITVLSTDPVKAKEIIDEIIDQLNVTIRKVEREKYQEIVEINEKMVLEKKNQLDSLEMLIRSISVKYGILDYITQSERVTEKYMDFLLSGKKGKDFEEAKTLYKNLQKYGRQFHNYHAQLNTVNGDYMNRLGGLEHAMKDLKKVQTYSNILVKPEVADKKSSPIRWLIVLSAMAAAIGFTFVLLLVLGYQNK
ncbi:MAG: hypothetical protein JKY48_13180 [Flavobacteriales bacterium]|nr:hypothetical protein [Flavobacteriales bacterium]